MFGFVGVPLTMTSHQLAMHCCQRRSVLLFRRNFSISTSRLANRAIGGGETWLCDVSLVFCGSAVIHLFRYFSYFKCYLSELVLKNTRRK
jgi:hypothetical protein